MQRRSTPWTLPLTLDRTPLCPGCGRMMAPKVTRFVDGVAICSECHGLPYPDPKAIAAWLRNPNLAKFTTWWQGLIFWMPDPTCHPGRTARDMLDHLDAPR